MPNGDSGNVARRGPRPLHAHIGMAAAGGASAQQMESLLRGIQAYQLHPYQRRMPGLHEIWRAGTASLSIAGKNFPPDGKPVLLLIPSMVNRAYIYNLMPERSLLRWLDGQGIAGVLFDWGDPLDDPQQADIESAVLRRLVPAVAALAKLAGAPVHALGYCMGGTLLAGAAQNVPPGTLESVAFLAAPWDFHGPEVLGSLRDRVRFWAPSGFAQIAARGRLPVDWIQSVFASLNPDATLRKFAKFAAQDPAAPEAHLFVAVEDWLNDGVDLPAALAQQVIQAWFLGNETGAGQWIVDGRAVDPAALDVPALVIASRRDNLVAWDSAVALQQKIPGAALHDPGCGHIGMIAGTQAVAAVWEPLAAWVRQHTCGRKRS